MANEENRRPLKIRGWKITQNFASWLSKQNVTPNQISIASIVFSVMAGIFFLSFQHTDIYGLLFSVAIILTCLFGRGCCNVFDGLVAVEGGKLTSSGELFNDVPDRISDAVIIITCGYASGFSELGWLAAVLSIMTAYVRTLARSIGAPSDFQGPMGKVPRMAVVSIATLLTPLEFLYLDSFYILQMGLVIISIGCVFTVMKRLKAAYDYMENNINV